MDGPEITPNPVTPNLFIPSFFAPEPETEVFCIGSPLNLDTLSSLSLAHYKMAHHKPEDKTNAKSLVTKSIKHSHTGIDEI